MLTNLLRLFAASIRASVDFILSPLFFVFNFFVAFFSRRSKTAANVIVKTQLIRDIILQAPPPSYQSSVKSGPGGNVVRLRILENSLQQRESDLTVRLQALERDRHHLDIKRDAFAKWEADFKEKEKSFDEKAGFQSHELSELASRRRELEQDAHQLVEERNILERLRSEHASSLQRFQEDAKSNQQRLDERESEITKLHDRFIRSQIESVERYRSEHDTLVESLQTRLKDVSDQHQKAEQSKTELEQRISFLTNELADRTEREFNLGSELEQLRHRLSDERGTFNREFGELSRSLSELKSRCRQYEQDLAAEERKREDLNKRAKLLDELEDSLNTRQDGLEDKENGLVTREEDLDSRENELSIRAKGLDDKDNELSLKEKDLNSKENDLSIKETDLNSRESDIVIKEKDLESKETDLASKEKDLDTKERDMITKEKDLDTKEKDLSDKEKDLNDKENGLDSKEKDLESKEKEMDGRVDDLRALQITIKQGMNRVAEAERQLADRAQHQEEIIIREDQEETPRESNEASFDVPDTTTSSNPPSSPTSNTPTRPTIMERVSRRTSEFVDKVSEAAHRRSSSYHMNHRYNQDPPNRPSKSRDGIKPEAK
ncbi:hypothetical protein ABW21_db0207259 [Orbilia brochopaga]|nr:hypothetical protein ABW21_db0207259 [Drechslerella brochopaga]